VQKSTSRVYRRSSRLVSKKQFRFVGRRGRSHVNYPVRYPRPFRPVASKLRLYIKNRIRYGRPVAVVDTLDVCTVHVRAYKKYRTVRDACYTGAHTIKRVRVTRDYGNSVSNGLVCSENLGKNKYVPKLISTIITALKTGFYAKPRWPARVSSRLGGRRYCSTTAFSQIDGCPAQLDMRKNQNNQTNRPTDVRISLE